MRVIEVGDDALLVEVADTTLALALALDARAACACTEVVPGARTVLLDGVRDAAAVQRWLSAWQPNQTPVAAPKVSIGVRYDGPDLAAVADAWGCAVEEVAQRHSARVWVAAFTGFAPGFSYLRALDDPAPPVPRRATPRPRIEPGSVALAGGFTGIYPSASPGGWQIIGHTDALLFDLSKEQPALLSPGVRVEFVAQ